MKDVPLFDDLSPPDEYGSAERIPITVPSKADLLADLAACSAVSQQLFADARVLQPELAEYVSQVALLCEQTRAFLGAREP